MAGNAAMEQLIPLVNGLQDMFAGLGMHMQFDLPQIAVVGGQSAGKSSVLENFIGRDFLPRGTGIVTRRPLILQLIQSKHEYGEFLHSRGKKFTDFNEIRNEIEAETDRITGSNKGISNVPISLRIFSPNVLNLTLIDLPGMTKVPIGDQPKDIEQQIRSMIYSFIKHENCLILAVTPANQDLANSDALKIAKEVDPEGKRTIGVITKLDLMDDGTDAKDILENKFLPLKRGYIGIVNRSQKDIDGRKDIKASVEAEKKFFSEHPSYRHIAHKLGTPYLQTVLNQQLTDHIRKILPSIQGKLQKQLLSLEKDVKKIESYNTDDPSMKTRILSQTLQQFKIDFEISIEGSNSNQVNTNELSGGAKINRLFHERFQFEIMKIKLDEYNLRKEIAYAIKNTHGIRIGLFTPQMAFETVVKKQIDRLREPSLKSVDLVVDEIFKILKKCIQNMSMYPVLIKEIDRIITIHTYNCDRICKEQLNQLIECESSYINTKHDDFVMFIESEKISDYSNNIPKTKNQVIRKGWMCILNLGKKKGVFQDYWIVLTYENILCYKDEEEKDLKYMISVDGLNIKDIETGGHSSRRNIFILFNPNGHNISKDFKCLELKCESQDEVDSWKEAFLSANVKLAKLPDGSKIEEAINLSADSILEKQTFIIRNMVESYMKIVTKTCLDLVPKFIMRYIIISLKNFINEELLAQLYACDIQDKFIEISPKDASKNKEIILNYQTCKEAMRIINDVLSATEKTLFLPPNNNDSMTQKMSLQSAVGVNRSLQNNPSQENHIPSRAVPPLPPGKPAPTIPNRSRF